MKLLHLMALDHDTMNITWIFTSKLQTDLFSKDPSEKYKYYEDCLTKCNYFGYSNSFWLWQPFLIHFYESSFIYSDCLDIRLLVIYMAKLDYNQTDIHLNFN